MKTTMTLKFETRTGHLVGELHGSIHNDLARASVVTGLQELGFDVSETLTVSDAEAALKDIAGYILPVYTIDGVKYVKLEHAVHLRNAARDALESAGVAAEKDEG